MLFKDLISTMDGKQQLVISINKGEKTLFDDVDAFSVLYNQDYLKLKVVRVAACVNVFDIPAIEVDLEGEYSAVKR